MGLLGASGLRAPLVFGLMRASSRTLTRKRDHDRLPRPPGRAHRCRRRAHLDRPPANVGPGEHRVPHRCPRFFFFSALTAVVPSLVPSRHLDRANAWVQGMENTGEVGRARLVASSSHGSDLVGALVVNLGGT